VNGRPTPPRAERDAVARARPVLLALALSAAGCASAPPAAPGAADSGAAASNPVDPWESWNRKVFAFNEAIDSAVLEPVARGYRAVVPKLVRTGVDNVLGNLHDVWSTANNFLEGRFQTGLEMGMRVIMNTTFGLGGLLDPATEMRLTRRSADLGQTLGVWGVGTGPFLELPLLGPSTVRDTAGLVVDYRYSPSRLPQTATGRDSVLVVEIVNTRAKLLDAGTLVNQVALDKYSFIRDAYLARRRDAVYGGLAPMDLFEDESESAPAPGNAASAATPPPAASAASAAAPAAK
jgi:phospholipid-binding lipoprotein MlaA